MGSVKSAKMGIFFEFGIPNKCEDINQINTHQSLLAIQYIYYFTYALNSRISIVLNSFLTVQCIILFTVHLQGENNFKVAYTCIKTTFKNIIIKLT